MHSRKSLLFNEGTPWMKKGNNDLFTIGSCNGVEVGELVGRYILNTLTKEYKKEQMGLYRDDCLSVFKYINDRRTASENT